MEKVRLTYRVNSPTFGLLHLPQPERATDERFADFRSLLSLEGAAAQAVRALEKGAPVLVECRLSADATRPPQPFAVQVAGRWFAYAGGRALVDFRRREPDRQNFPKNTMLSYGDDLYDSGIDTIFAHPDGERERVRLWVSPETNLVQGWSMRQGRSTLVIDGGRSDSQPHGWDYGSGEVEWPSAELLSLFERALITAHCALRLRVAAVGGAGLGHRGGAACSSRMAHPS